MQDQDTTVRVPLRARDGSVRAYALIDAADAAFIGEKPWRLSNENRAYRRISGSGKYERIFLHRLILGLPAWVPGGPEVDHINRNRLDNRRSNMRVVQHAGNMQNRGSNRGSKSQYRGVTWDASHGQWEARVRIDGRQRRIGRFATEAEAGQAALDARRRVMPFATD